MVNFQDVRLKLFISNKVFFKLFQSSKRMIPSADDVSIDTDVTPPKIDFQFSKDDEGRFQCLHPDCANKTYAFQWKNGFQDHWLDKHTTNEEKVNRMNQAKF